MTVMKTAGGGCPAGTEGLEQAVQADVARRRVRAPVPHRHLEKHGERG